MAEELHALIIDDLDYDLHLRGCGRYRFLHVSRLRGFRELTCDGLIATLRGFSRKEGFGVLLEQGATLPVDVCMLNAHLGEGRRSKNGGIDLLWEGVRLNGNADIARSPVLIYSTAPGPERLIADSLSRYQENCFTLPDCLFFQIGLRPNLIESLVESLDSLVSPSPASRWGASELRRVASVNSRVLRAARIERLGTLLRDLRHYLLKKIPYQPDPMKQVKSLFHKLWVRDRVIGLLRADVILAVGLEYGHLLEQETTRMISALRSAERAGLPRSVNESMSAFLVAFSGLIQRLHLLKSVETPATPPVSIRRYEEALDKIDRAFSDVSRDDITHERFPDNLIRSSYDLRSYWQGRQAMDLLLWQMALYEPFENLRHHVSKVFIGLMDPVAEALELRPREELVAAFSPLRLKELGVTAGSTLADLLDGVRSNLYEAYGRKP